MGKTQAAYELYEQVYIQHYNLEKDMKNMVADHEEQMLSKEAEFQLELTKKAAENAKALHELHDVHMASMKTQEVGYEERLRKKRRQVQALMDQVTDVNNFVQEYYQKYNLANYRPREPMGNQGQAGLGIVAAMFLERQNQHKKQHGRRRKHSRRRAASSRKRQDSIKTQTCLACLLFHIKPFAYDQDKGSQE
eukprot:s6935_g1.t2